MPVSVPNFEIEETTLPNKEAEELLGRLVWGTPGQMQYQYAKGIPSAYLATKIHWLFLARKAGKVVGVYALVQHDWGYMRYLLGVEKEHLRTGVGKALVEHLHNTFEDRLPDDAALVGTIEETNERSLELSLRYYEKQRTLEAVTFSRRFPRRRQDVLPGEAKDFGNPDYFDAPELRAYTLWQDGRPVAGVLAQPHHWRLISLGSPYLNRLLPHLQLLLGTTADNYRFLTFHNWWGDATHHNRLWEHALADLQATSGVAVGDRDCPLWRSINASLNRGVVGAIVGTNILYVTGRNAPKPFWFPPINAC